MSPEFLKYLFSIKKTLSALLTASLLSILIQLLCHKNPSFSHWLYQTGSFYATALKSLVLLIWLFPLSGLGYQLYTYNWKSNLLFLLQVFCILLLTVLFLFVC